MSITDMINLPVSTHKYKIYDIDMLPATLLCIRVKNQYDENRLEINSKYKPAYVSHFQTISDTLQPSYYYGIELKLKPEYTSMLTYINRASIFKNKHTTGAKKISQYSNLLHEYNLTCNTCYGYYSDGVWPIDLHHLQLITKTNFNDEISSGFTQMLVNEDTDNPIYTRLLNFNILVLTKATGYDS